MVRNVASIASLCESSPHRPNSAQPPEQEQRDTSSAGSISYPKQRQADDKARSDGNPVLSYYQKELLLLEQQNKKRLFMARQESEQESATSMQPSPDRRAGNCRNPALEEYERQLGLLDEESKNRQLEREPEQEPTGGLVDHGGPQVLQDHEMEVILLEQQRTMDVLMARREAKARQRSVPLCSNIGSERHENHALRDYQMELKLLEPLNRKRLLQAKRDQEQEQSRNSRFTPATKANAEMYAEPFCKFLSENPTVFHAVAAMKRKLKAAGFTQLSERGSWDIKRSGSYFVERNGSALIAFSVGAKYESGNGAAVVAGHIDALTAKLKPVSKVPNKAGYLQLGVAPYAGGLNSTWWDRDLGIAGRVHLRKDGKIVTKLVNLDYPIARVPTLAPHFGAAAQGPFNPETQMVPILGLESSDPVSTATAPEPFSKPSLLGDSVGSFAKTQPPALVEAIEEALASTIDWDEEEDGDLSMHSSDDKDDDEARYAVGEIVNWELELYDVQAATRGGLHKELIYGGRVDDKLCSWAALEALVEAQQHDADSSIFKVVGLFDDEEIGSLLRQGARGNFLPSVLERAAGSLADHKPTSDLMGRTYANSFLVSSDVTHAVNPNFLSAYLENHAPHLNVGVAIAADPNGHMTTDSVSTTIFQRCAEKAGAKLQVFQIRNDSRSGGTIGPMTSSATGMRAIDAGLPQLSMHSIRATTGALDPGLGVITFKAFLNGFEEVDKEFK